VVVLVLAGDERDDRKSLPEFHRTSNFDLRCTDLGDEIGKTKTRSAMSSWRRTRRRIYMWGLDRVGFRVKIHYFRN
jgi:hypothetical protein